MNKIGLIIALFFISACSTSGVKTKENSKEEISQKDKVKNNVLDLKHKVIDQKPLTGKYSSVVIDWYEKGDGAEITNGDLVEIDYKVKLTNGTVIDGNHLLKLPSFPFLVGFKMQTEVWDLVLKQMRIGDFVHVNIPAKFARGEKGIEGVVPKNADNILVIRALKKVQPDRIIDGVKIWNILDDKNEKLKFSEGKKIVFHAMASSNSMPLYANTFRTNTPFTFALGDQGLVPGLRKALINAKKSDRMYVVVPAKEAYGEKGYMDFVKPNEDVFYNIMVMDVLEK